MQEWKKATKLVRTKVEYYLNKSWKWLLSTWKYTVSQRHSVWFIPGEGFLSSRQGFCFKKSDKLEKNQSTNSVSWHMQIRPTYFKCSSDGVYFTTAWASSCLLIFKPCIERLVKSLLAPSQSSTIPPPHNLTLFIATSGHFWQMWSDISFEQIIFCAGHNSECFRLYQQENASFSTRYEKCEKFGLYMKQACLTLTRTISALKKLISYSLLMYFSWRSPWYKTCLIKKRNDIDKLRP